MPTKIRLPGAAHRIVRISSESSPLEVTITLATGEELPDGDLYATAKSQNDTITLDAVEGTGDGGVVTVVATIDPADFEEYGGRIWSVEIGVLDAGPGEGDGDDTARVLFAGSIVFEKIIANVIASTTIQEAAP